MDQNILSISGKQGLFKLVSQGRNMLIVESLLNGKRVPAYSHDRVVSLSDISIYTNDGGDKPLYDILESVKTANNGAPVDIKDMDDADVRKYFGEIMPDFDSERVYTNDIRKLFSWYNQLLNAGITDFKISKDVEETPQDPKED